MRQAREIFDLLAPRFPVLERLRARKTALASVFAMSIRAAGALLTIAIFTLAARAMSADEFGQLAVWFNAMSLLAVASVFGQDTLIARSWGEYSGRGEHGVARRAYRFGWGGTVVSSTVFVVGLLVLAPVANLRIAPTALYAAATFLFAQTLLHFSSHSSRVLVGFVVSEVNRELTWRLVLLAVVALAFWRQDFTLAQFFFSNIVSAEATLTSRSVPLKSTHARTRPSGDNIAERHGGEGTPEEPTRARPAMSQRST